MMKKVLLIEDNQETSHAYSDYLVEQYEVRIARSAAEGLTVAVEYQPDIILLDIMLPGGKNGFDFLKDLKNNKNIAHIPVIVLTNLDDQRETALESGARACFVKANVNLSEVQAEIQAALTADPEPQQEK